MVINIQKSTSQAIPIQGIQGQNASTIKILKNTYMNTVLLEKPPHFILIQIKN